MVHGTPLLHLPARWSSTAPPQQRPSAPSCASVPASRVFSPCPLFVFACFFALCFSQRQDDEVRCLAAPALPHPACARVRLCSPFSVVLAPWRGRCLHPRAAGGAPRPCQTGAYWLPNLAETGNLCTLGARKERGSHRGCCPQRPWVAPLPGFQRECSSFLWGGSRQCHSQHPQRSSRAGGAARSVPSGRAVPPAAPLGSSSPPYQKALPYTWQVQGERAGTEPADARQVQYSWSTSSTCLRGIPCPTICFFPLPSWQLCRATLKQRKPCKQARPSWPCPLLSGSAGAPSSPQIAGHGRG